MIELTHIDGQGIVNEGLSIIFVVLNGFAHYIGLNLKALVLRQYTGFPYWSQ